MDGRVVKSTGQLWLPLLWLKLPLLGSALKVAGDAAHGLLVVYC